MKLILLQTAPEPIPPAITYMLEHYDWLIGLFILLVLSGLLFLVYRVFRWTVKEIRYSLHTK